MIPSVFIIQFTQSLTTMLKIFLFLSYIRLTSSICGSKQTIINHGTQLCCRNDSNNIPTIGIGYHLTRNDSETVMLMYNLTLSNVLSDCQRYTNKYCLTNDQAEDIFNQTSYAEAIQCADEYVPNLPLMKRNAIIDVAFTSCRALNTFVKMKKALQMKNWIEAAKELKDSRWCIQVKERRCTEDYNCIRDNEVVLSTTNNSLVLNSNFFCYNTSNNTRYCTSKFQCSKFPDCQPCSPTTSSVCIIDSDYAQTVCLPLALNGICIANLLNQPSMLKRLMRTTDGRITLLIIFFPLPLVVCILLSTFICCQEK